MRRRHPTIAHLVLALLAAYATDDFIVESAESEGGDPAVRFIAA